MHSTKNELKALGNDPTRGSEQDKKRRGSEATARGTLVL